MTYVGLPTAMVFGRMAFAWHHRPRHPPQPGKGSQSDCSLAQYLGLMTAADPEYLLQFQRRLAAALKAYQDLLSSQHCLSTCRPAPCSVCK